jgi:hypothetical protein
MLHEYPPQDTTVCRDGNGKGSVFLLTLFAATRRPDATYPPVYIVLHYFSHPVDIMHAQIAGNTSVTGI